MTPIEFMTEEGRIVQPRLTVAQARVLDELASDETAPLWDEDGIWILHDGEAVDPNTVRSLQRRGWIERVPGDPFSWRLTANGCYAQAAATRRAS